MKHLLTLLCLAVLPPSLVHAAESEPLYTQHGADRAFAELLSTLPQGSNSIQGVTGSVIHVNQRLVDVGPDANHSIQKDINIHTLCNSSIPRNDFLNWSRWYQEDGNVQIFRLFKGETNVRNQRPLAARIEAFGGDWAAGTTNEWHEWSGTYTIVKPEEAAIFQDFNSKSIWAFHLGMNDTGDVIFDPRRPRGKEKIIATNMTGKPFHIRVRDNGLDYEVYLNSEKVASGSFLRLEGKNSFRWGMYKGESEMKNDAMIFVTGATFH